MKTIAFIILVAVLMFVVFGKNCFSPATIRQRIQSVVMKCQNVSRSELGSEASFPEEAPLEAAAKQVAYGRDDAEFARSLREAQAEQVLIINPLIRKLLDLNKEDLGTKNLLKLPGQLKCFTGRLIFPIYILSAAILLLMLITRKTSFSGEALMLAQLGFRVGRILLIVAAVISLTLRFTLKYNLLLDTGFVFLLSLFALLASSAVSLKLYDWNSPVWNRMFIAATWPAASSLIVRLL